MRAYQASFVGGELSPSLSARSDLAKFDSGARTMLNWMVHAEGGASTRPGTIFRGIAAQNQKPRLIRFSFSVTQSYVLEFTDGHMRVWMDMGLVLLPIVSATYKWTASGAGTNEYYLELAAGGDPGIPLQDDVYENSVLMTEGTLGSLAAGETGYGDNDTLGYDTIYVRLTDGADPDTKAAGYVETVFRTASPYSSADLPYVKFTQSADTMYLAHPDYAVRSLTRSAHYVWTFSTVTFGAGLAAPAGLAGAQFPAVGGTTIQVGYAVTSVSATGEESLPCAEVLIAVDNPWTAGARVPLTWTQTAGADSYNIYKNTRGFLGYIGSVVDSAAPSFTDDNIVPDSETNPPTAQSVFTGAGDYPGAVGIFQQRLVLARTDNQPQTVFASNTGALLNFNKSLTVKDTDAIEATLASGRLCEIKHIVPLDKLILLTGEAEIALIPGSSGTALTPTSLEFRFQSYRGCDDLVPIIVGNTVIFVQRGSNIIRDMFYSLEQDGYTGTDLTVMSRHMFKDRTISSWDYYQNPDSILWCIRDDGVMLGLTYLREHQVLAWHRHTTNGTFEEICVLPGELQDEVYFSVKRNIGGVDYHYIETLAERLPDDDVVKAVCADSCLQYSGAAATVISGLDHLEGEEVAILADGSYVTGKTVSGGQITLDHAAEFVTVGLGFTCDLETLDINFQSQEGSTQGTRKRMNRAIFRLQNSRGLQVGPSADKLVEMKERSIEDYSDPTALFTGDKEIVLAANWDRSGRIFVRQSYPLPSTILAISPEVTGGN